MLYEGRSIPYYEDRPIPVRYHPKGRHLPALERNVLQYRAFEMMIILFEIEDLKRFIRQRIPEGTKDRDKKACNSLVLDGIITNQESKEIKKFMDYRNLIGHDIHKLTFDVSREFIPSKAYAIASGETNIL